MNKTKLTTTLLLCIAVSSLSCAGMFGRGKEPEPTAIVIDAETGEPIEGAVGLAVWWGEAAVGEGGGGVSVVKRKATSISDRKGKIYIDDFWDWHFFKSGAPHLTVYKCGYVCWNRYRIYKPGLEPYDYRYDFGRENRTVRLERCPENFSFLEHDWFITSSVTHGAIDHSGHFYDAFDECEMKGRIDERTERDKKRKKKN